MDKVGVGMLGSGFVAAIHLDCFNQIPDAEVRAVASLPEGKPDEFARKHGIPKHFTDYRRLLELDEIDVITIGIPNDLHCEVAVAAAQAGKHVICEKPLCMNLAEADRMIQACNDAGVKLMYAEELCFAPKYVRCKELCDTGALGKLYMLKQCEKHDGPHAAWFWDVERSGGGVVMDMGCHGFEFFRWVLGKPKALNVYAEMSLNVQQAKTRGEDNAIVIVNFDGGCTCVAEEGWAKFGGMEDRAEFYGSRGVIYADLLQGTGIRTYTDVGYDYAVEKASTTKGWTFTTYHEAWNYGFPQEMAHFIDCVKNDKQPLETGEDGRVVLEIILAAYESARTGKRIDLPFRPAAKKPIDLWLAPA
jgi:predicted dehydrogenase